MKYSFRSLDRTSMKHKHHWVCLSTTPETLARCRICGKTKMFIPKWKGGLGKYQFDKEYNLGYNEG